MKFLLRRFFLPFTNTDLSSIRNLYKVPPTGVTKANELLDIAEKNSSINPVFSGYKGATKIIKANMPFTFIQNGICLT